MAYSQSYPGIPWAPTSPHMEAPQTNEVRTIFVLGFPSDVKERELQNLLRWWPGYEACQMNFKGEQPIGFALFSSAGMAIAARDALQNLVFDAESNVVLRAEMAKKNLFVKKGFSAPQSSYEHQPTYHSQQSWAPQRLRGGYAGVPQVYGPQMAHTSYIAGPTTPYDPYQGYPVPVAAPVGYATVRNTKDNPPCNTLFIGNLGGNTSEAELRGVFSSQPGFRQMKVLRQHHGTVCFIDFADVASAIHVHQVMQGALLSTSDRGGIRIQYSKNPYGARGPRKEGSLSVNSAPAVAMTSGEDPVGVAADTASSQQASGQDGASSAPSFSTAADEVASSTTSKGMQTGETSQQEG